MPLGSGRKQTKVHTLFKSASKVGKMERVACRFCDIVFSKSGSRMEKHIKMCKKCPMEVKQNYLETHDMANIKTPRKSENFSFMTSTEIKKTSSNSTQSLLSESSFVDVLKSKDKGEIDEALARCVYASKCSFKLFDTVYWKNAFQLLRPSYKLPSRKQLANNLLDKEYLRVSHIVKEQVLTKEYVGLTCDGWSNIRNESIINFIVTTPEPVFWKAIPTGTESHTGDYMAKEIMKVIVEVGPNKVLGIVTDNAANMKAAWNILEKDYPHIFFYGCLAHGLNLLFTNYKEIKTLKDLMVEGVRIVNDINRGHKSLAIFRESQSEYKKTHPETKLQTLKLPVQSRWGSIVACLESLKDNKCILKRIAIGENVNEILKPECIKSILSEIFWDKIKGFLTLLTPIYKSIKFIESDVPQISNIVEIFYELEESINIYLSSSPFTKPEEEIVKEKFKKRKLFCVKSIHHVANLVNPRFKGHRLTQEEQVDACELLLEIGKFMEDINEDELREELANYRASTKIFANKYVLDSIHKCTPIIWWQIYIGATSLSKLSCRLLDLPATSASVERSFSSYSNIHTKNRNRLQNEKAMKLLYVSQNLSLTVYSKMAENNLLNKEKCSSSLAKEVESKTYSAKYVKKRILTTPSPSPKACSSKCSESAEVMNLSDSDEMSFSSSNSSDEFDGFEDSSDDSIINESFIDLSDEDQ